MENGTITIFVQKSIEKNVKMEEKYITITFWRNNIDNRNYLGNALKLPDGYGKEEFRNANI